MKLSIIAILISISAIAYSQGRYADEAKAAREKTNEMLLEDIDRLTHPIGHIIMDQHDMASGEDTFYYSPLNKPDTILISNTGGLSETYRMIYGYLESRDPIKVHYVVRNSLCFINDPAVGGCANERHYKMGLPDPTFEGFINYVLNQKP